MLNSVLENKTIHFTWRVYTHYLLLILLLLYTVSQKKLCHFYFCNIFGFSWPILTIVFTVTISIDRHAYLE